MDPVSQWINTVGFPVVAYLLIFKLLTSTLDRNTQAMAAMNQTLQDLREAVKGLSVEREKRE